MRRLRSHLLHVAAVLLGVFVLLQLVPYGWTHSNPPVRADAPWPDAESEALARRSCYSCHSNETDWPAYSYVAPMSWLVRKDVDDGRARLNFSEWGLADDEADDAAEVVREGAMPPDRYTAIHRSAKLSDRERRVLAAALEQMVEGREEAEDRAEEAEDRADDEADAAEDRAKERDRGPDGGGEGSGGRGPG